MLRLAAQAPCCSGPVTSTLGSTRRSGTVLWRSLQQPAAARSQFSKSSLARCRRQVASAARRLAPARTCWWRTAWLPRLGQAARPASQRLSTCQRCQSSPTAAQPARHPLASPRPCRLRRSRPHCHALLATATFNLSAPLLCDRHRACQLSKALPNMPVNRTRYGKAPWPRSARCPCCASRPGRLASARRLPLR